MVMVGTFSEYQAPEERVPVTELAPLESTRMYGASKASGGLMAGATATELGVGLRILRFFHVYGPGEAEHRLLPSLVDGLTHSRRVPLSIGTQVRDFVYVDDAVDALVRAAVQLRTDRSPGVGIWNVCIGIGHSVRDFSLRLAGMLGARRELLGFGDLDLRRNDVPWMVGDGERIRRELGWHPAHDLVRGLGAAVSIMMAHKQLTG